MKIALIGNINGGLVGMTFTSVTEISIGREIGNTIAPLTADGMSRHHAKIYFKDNQWFVEDLGSTNGSFRFGQKIEAPTVLCVRDQLQFGKFSMSVDEIDVTPAVAPAPAAAPAPAPESPKPTMMTPAEAAA